MCDYSAANNANRAVILMFTISNIQLLEGIETNSKHKFEQAAASDQDSRFLPCTEPDSAKDIPHAGPVKNQKTPTSASFIYGVLTK